MIRNVFLVLFSLSFLSAGTPSNELIQEKIEYISQALNHTLENYQVKLIEDLDAFHEAIGWPDAPEWVVGHSNPETMTVTLYAQNPKVEESLTHQLTNLFLFDKYSKEIPHWLRVGVAMNLANQGYKATDQLERFRLDPSKLPSFSELEMTHNRDFGKMGGYALSYGLVEYIVSKEGWPKIFQLLDDCDSFEEKQALFNEWIRHLCNDF